MMRCPQCNSIFPDTEHFCELDGTPLVAGEPPQKTRVVVVPSDDQPTSKGLVILLAIAGVIIGILLFLIYFNLTREPASEDQHITSSANPTTAQQPIPARPLQAAPLPSESPSEEPSPSPSVEPSPSPSPQSTPSRIVLSSSPISTASGAKTGPVLIKLNDGLTIEADEAWQTGEGIWYRRHGVVTLLNPKDVKSIENAPAASPSPGK
jgi:hypothetical protein